MSQLLCLQTMVSLAEVGKQPAEMLSSGIQGAAMRCRASRQAVSLSFTSRGGIGRQGALR